VKTVGYFIFACVLLSLAQAALSALVIIVMIMLIFGIFYHPAETFGFLAFGLASTLFQRHPMAAVWLIGLFLVAGIVLSMKGSNPLVPTDHAPVRSVLPSWRSGSERGAAD
jgi:hypothetical protein